MKIFMSYVNAHQRVTSAERYFNNRVDRITHSVDMSASFPSQSCHCPMAHEKSDHVDRVGDYAKAQQHGLLLTKTNLSTAFAECPVWQLQRPTQNSQHGTIPQAD